MKLIWILGVVLAAAACHKSEESAATTTNAQTAAPSATAATPAKAGFAWTESPSLDRAPTDGAYVGLGDRVLPANVSIEHSAKRDEWSLRVESKTKSDDEPALGPSVTFHGKPTVGAPVSVAMNAAHQKGFFQAPLKGYTAAKYADTSSFNDAYASTIEITKLEGGKASGRFAVAFRDDDNRKLWAAGTFTDAPYTETKY